MTTRNLLSRLRSRGSGKNRIWPAVVLGGALAIQGRLAAAPGELSQTPLFLTTGVVPNIFLLLDDSLSMDYEILKSEGARIAHPSEGSHPNEGTVDFTPDTEVEKLQLCVGYNVLAYNPDVTEVDYTPWVGVDKDGTAFDTQNPAAARANPYTGDASSGLCQTSGFVRNDNGTTCNLLAGGDFGSNGAVYYPWDDDGDGVYQDGECLTGSPVYVSTLSEDLQRRYANWFSYYRKREYILKRALSEIIEKSEVRVGLATINRTPHVTKDTAVGTPVKSLADDANKTALKDNLLGLDSEGETPLRIALKRVGDYFAGGAPTDLFGFTPELPADSAQGYSPILAEAQGGDCQQNFALVVSDGYWNALDDPGLGNADGDNNTPYDGQSYADPFGATYRPANNPPELGSTLADVAMHFYETDLIDGLPDNVPETRILKGTDDNPQQHLVTFTIAFGIDGTLSDDPPNREDPFAWPEPVIDTETTVDDMRHAAWNGRGLFLGAQNPGQLNERLDAALGDVRARTTTAAAAVALSSTSLESGAIVYQAGFDSGLWSGTLSAFQLEDSELSGTPVWEAHTELDTRTDARVMITHNGSAGVEFQFPGDFQSPLETELSPAQVEDLLADAPWPWPSATPLSAQQASDNQLFGENITAYLRGLRTNEGKTAGAFRERGSLLSDIVHSAPVFVGAPDPGLYPDNIESVSYQAWANNLRSATPAGAADRREMVYVGTNGGSLHGFDAETGDEIFAYIPGLIFSADSDAGLHLLAQQNYGHRYYVDNTPAVSEVFLNGQWRTILIGTLRGGGKGLFALDVSEPDAGFADKDAAVGKVLWEYTNDDLGFTFSRPTLAKLNNGRWAAIFGNGYNSDPSGDGTAKLFIHYLDDVNHTDVKILETNSGSIVGADCNDVNSDCNGLSTPAVVDLTGDGVADRVYAGDLKGNVWVFDLSGSTATQWRSAFPVSGTGEPIPLFTAQVRDADGVLQPQPITTELAVTLHPTQSSAATEPNTLVFFGTGQFIVANDTQTTEVQSFYGLWDSGAPISGVRSDVLVEQTINQFALFDPELGNETFIVRSLSSNQVDYETKKGWYVDFLTDSGERVVVNPLLIGELVVYTTLIPGGSGCGAAGESAFMTHDLLTGGQPAFPAIDLNNNGTWEEEEALEVDVAGVKADKVYWQPTGGRVKQGEVDVFLPAEGGDDSLDIQRIRGSLTKAVRSSWARFEFD